MNLQCISSFEYIYPHFSPSVVCVLAVWQPESIETGQCSLLSMVTELVESNTQLVLLKHCGMIRSMLIKKRKLFHSFFSDLTEQSLPCDESGNSYDYTKHIDSFNLFRRTRDIPYGCWNGQTEDLFG